MVEPCSSPATLNLRRITYHTMLLSSGTSNNLKEYFCVQSGHLLDSQKAAQKYRLYYWLVEEASALDCQARLSYAIGAFKTSTPQLSVS